MWSDITEANEELPNPRSIKVHCSMCAKLINLVEKILRILPEIEASRPRCSSGLQPLVSLNVGIGKAKSLLQQCCEDSKLYLAINGEAILTRCQKTTNSLEQNLSHIQNNVPVLLAAEISHIISDLKGTVFSFDPAEEEAGKAIRAFLKSCASSNDAMENYAIEALRFASLRLNITSHKALLIERRSIQRLLEEVGDANPPKKDMLSYLKDLLKKHGKSIVRELSEDSHKESFPLPSSRDVSSDQNSHPARGPHEPTMDMSDRGLPPEEYKCPLSSRLMYDPVIIASGLTFERMWIERWFDEGYDICPKTQAKLTHLSMTPNVVMKNLISKWCTTNGVTIPDPYTESAGAQLLDTSLISVCSLSKSMNDLHLPIDFCMVSIVSSDSSNSNSSNVKADDEPCGFHKCQVNDRVLRKLDKLPWECQCGAVEAVKEQFEHGDGAFHLMPVENFVGPVLRFLRNALDRGDVNALRTGTQLLLAIVSKCRDCVSDVPVEGYGLLAALIDSEVGKEALVIIELLSHHPCCRSQIVVSGALNSILKILETQIIEFLEPAIKIINNLSSSAEMVSSIAPLELVPKLVPLIEDDALVRYCLSILKNLSHIEDIRVFLAENSECIGSIVRLLEVGNHEVQEHAVIVLLSLCSQWVRCCEIVMHEGAVPPLVFVSYNGNEKAKAGAVELLRLLHDTGTETRGSFGGDVDLSCGSFDRCKERKSPPRGSRVLRFKLPKSFRHGFSALKNKK